jgi:hypothetical protein
MRYVLVTGGVISGILAPIPTEKSTNFAMG